MSGSNLDLLSQNNNKIPSDPHGSLGGKLQEFSPNAHNQVKYVGWWVGDGNSEEHLQNIENSAFRKTTKRSIIKIMAIK